MADEMQRIFDEAGYTYPGTPEAGARLLLSIIRDAQGEAKATNTKYTQLIEGLHAALDHSPIRQTPNDPLKHIALLCERLDEGQVASIANVVKVLRARHPDLSAQRPDDQDFLADLDDLTDPELAKKLAPVVNASLGYWQALQGDDHARVALALTKWSHVVAAYIDEDP